MSESRIDTIRKALTKLEETSYPFTGLWFGDFEDIKNLTEDIPTAEKLPEARYVWEE